MPAVMWLNINICAECLVSLLHGELAYLSSYPSYFGNGHKYLYNNSDMLDPSWDKLKKNEQRE